MLRIFLANVLIFAFVGILVAQTPQQECNTLLEKARKSHTKGDYADAFAKYRAVKLCAPDKAAEMDKLIEKLFADVNGERQRADDARVLAEDALLMNKRIIDNIFFYAGKFGLAYQDGKFGFIDKEGNVMINFDYVGARPFNELGFAWAHTGKSEVCIDTFGREYEYADDLLNLTNKTAILELSAMPCFDMDLHEIQKNKGHLKFKGCFPDSLYKYTNLEILVLENIGEMPAGISNLVNLKVLVCADCMDLPKDIAKCPKLEKIIYKGSNITALPDDFHKLKNLKVLDLSKSRSEGILLPANFNELKTLEVLDLSSANLSQDAIKLLKGLVNLKALNLSENEKMGDFPSDFFDGLPKLEQLDLSAMELTKFPNIKKLQRLEQFDISFNLIDVIDLDLAKYPKLRNLNFYGLDNLAECDIKGLSASLLAFSISSESLNELPAGILNSPNIEELEIEELKIEKFPNLAAASKLRKLTLHQLRQLSNVDNLKKCTHLETMDISLCFAMFDKDLEFLGTFQGLRTLNLMNNAIKKLPDSMVNLKKLTTLDVSINKLEAMPESFMINYKNLKNLNLSGNKFPNEVKARIKAESTNCEPSF